MSRYAAPTRDMQFVFHELLQIERELRPVPAHAELTRELVDQVVAEAGTFVAEVLFPLNAVGDREGCRFQNDGGVGAVTTPTGFKDAYRRFCQAGWPSVVADPAYGGQGLPHTVGFALEEMLNSANHAWAMYPCLTHGAYGALLAHGTAEQKRIYLPKLVSGRWSGTMCLTEPQAGTDLGLIRTRAEPDGGDGGGQGAYKLTGTKIFVSAGEHDLCENIVHLVLARLPDAPAGSKGISLFIVPKFVPDAAGEVGARNRIQCGAIEHKMGIHGNATCVMNLEEATGFLVGEPHRGLPAMFVMMNSARIGVGMQGLGLTEVAYQNAVVYARERLQSRSLAGPKAPDRPADPIIVHPDVRRMLLTQRAYAEGGRALAYWVALMFDKASGHPDPEVRKQSDDMVALFTPVVKSFLTDNSVTCTNLALQVFGGHGYIRESGMEQYVRDARITTIYEGTNTVQALDLLGRKVLMDSGAKLRAFAAQVAAFIEQEGRDEGMGEFVDPLGSLGAKLEKLTMEVGMRAMQDREEVGAAAVDYLRLLGHFAFAYFWARAARIALDKAASGDAFYTAKLATARFYFRRLLPETESLIAAIRSGAGSLLAMDAESF